jgi:hypothetical protein
MQCDLPRIYRACNHVSIAHAIYHICHRLQPIKTKKPYEAIYGAIRSQIRSQKRSQTRSHTKLNEAMRSHTKPYEARYEARKQHLDSLGERIRVETKTCSHHHPYPRRIVSPNVSPQSGFKSFVFADDTSPTCAHPLIDPCNVTPSYILLHTHTLIAQRRSPLYACCVTFASDSCMRYRMQYRMSRDSS